MIWPDTPRVPAHVVEFEAVWNRTDQRLVGDPMRRLFPVTILKPPIARRRRAAGPQPAAVLGDDHLSPKPVPGISIAASCPAPPATEPFRPFPIPPAQRVPAGTLQCFRHGHPPPPHSGIYGTNQVDTSTQRTISSRSEQLTHVLDLQVNSCCVLGGKLLLDLGALEPPRRDADPAGPAPDLRRVEERDRDRLAPGNPREVRLQLGQGHGAASSWRPWPFPLGVRRMACHARASAISAAASARRACAACHAAMACCQRRQLSHMLHTLSAMETHMATTVPQSTTVASISGRPSPSRALRRAPFLLLLLLPR